MSRLAPLVTRTQGPRAIALALPRQQAAPVRDNAQPEWMADLRLFLTAWAGGVVFFGTLLS